MSLGPTQRFDNSSYFQEGSGKPGPWKQALFGFWSRRINDEHRII
ncbi:type II toxin-antitoxin system YoeB family toxin [Desulfosarcina sp.]